MATNESDFKSEIKSSFERVRCGAIKVWAPTDKIRAGVSDLHVVHQRFYAIELKWVLHMPVKHASNMLVRPFTKKQMLFLREVNRCAGGVGIGIIGLGTNDAIIVTPDDLTEDGNISKSGAEAVFQKAHNHLVKAKGFWNVEKVFEYQKQIFRPITLLEAVMEP